MNPNHRPVDDQMLAAFLARALSKHDFHLVLAYLVASNEARELMQMAAEALSAVTVAGLPLHP